MAFFSGAVAACEPDDLTARVTREDGGEDPSVRLDGGPPPVGRDASAPPPLPPPVERDAGVPGPTDAGPRDSGPPPPPPHDAGAPQPPPDAGIDPGRECYTEPFDPTVSISDLRAGFSGGNAFSTLLEVMRRRYPAGYDLLIEEEDDPYTGSFTDGSSFELALESSMTEVHEATHGWDYGHALFYEYFGYWLRADLTPQLSFDVDGFPRSQIYSMIEDDSTDLYSGLYLTGDQGTRGLLELLDETNCYINGLGAIAAVPESIPFGISGRDGAVAFLYYVELYLRRARTQDPQLYATMQGDAALVELIKTQWLRTHFFLMFADQEPQLGIHDGEIRALLYAPANIAEISMLIGRCVDQTNCLCD